VFLINMLARNKFFLALRAANMREIRSSQLIGRDRVAAKAAECIEGSANLFQISSLAAWKRSTATDSLASASSHRNGVFKLAKHHEAFVCIGPGSLVSAQVIAMIHPTSVQPSVKLRKKIAAAFRFFLPMMDGRK
jgi:hypothetical protein